MRTLSATLTAAQKSPSALPYPKVEVKDKVGGITHLTWTRLYNEIETTTQVFHAAAMPADGSLIRLRINSSNNLILYQRVTNPGPGSDYATWTSFGGQTAYAVALAAFGSTVFAFAVNFSSDILLRRESTNYGASWDAWVSMGSIGGTSSTRLAACFKSSTEAIVIYSQSNAVYRRRLSGGSWEAAAAWTNSVASITGVAVVYLGDWNIVVTGTQITTLKPHVWTCLLGDGYSQPVGNWSTLKELTMAEANSNVTFSFPCLIIPDVFRAFFGETYSGSEAYYRPQWTYAPPGVDFINNLWREPVPFNLFSSYQLALCFKSPYVWLTNSHNVWRSTLTPASVDITDDISLLATKIEESDGEIAISLRNDDGRYNTLGTGTYEAIKLNSEILFSPGYRTTAGVEVSSGQAYWISGWDYISQGPKSAFVLRGVDAWSLLERWKARRQYTWAAASKNILQILTWIHARAGLELTVTTSSSASSNQYPAFTIHPGESGKTAVLQLLAMVPDVLRFRGACAYIINPLASNASQYPYGSGATPHIILEGKYITRPKETNRAQVFGSGVFTEDWDWDEIALVYDQLTQAKDINLTTTTQTHERGAAELRDTSIHAPKGHILVPLNCGQEMYDVIDITDALAGLAAAGRRVLGLSHLFTSAKGQYALKIGLGGV